jgi:transforming growth factor-beta-induced protein
MKAWFKFVSVFLIALFAFGSFVPAAQAAPAAKGSTIVEIAASDPNFSILVMALQAADPAILQTLSGKGQFTVFAPTNDAFVALLAELSAQTGTTVTAADLLANKSLLNQVLLYHVARGNRDSGEVLSSDRIRTLNGGFLFQSGGVLTDANGRTANIIATDIQASNGVIHVIDRVVLP